MDFESKQDDNSTRELTPQERQNISRALRGLNKGNLDGREERESSNKPRFSWQEESTSSGRKAESEADFLFSRRNHQDIGNLFQRSSELEKDDDSEIR